MSNSILIDKLKDFKYYVRKCPLYLQNDENFLVHFKIWYDFMISETFNKGTINTSDVLLSLINIYDPNYEELLKSLKEPTPENPDPPSDILDKLGSIYDIQRNFSIVVDNQTKTISLNDHDFLIYIKSKIIKNNYDGSYETLKKLYTDVGLDVYFKNGSTSATLLVILLVTEDNKNNYSENIQDLFKAGYLTTIPMGISYTCAVVRYDKLLVWANLDATQEEILKYKTWGETDSDNVGVWDL